MLYPILTSSRMVSSLDGVWDFKLDDGKGFENKWYEKKAGAANDYGSAGFV